jgi:hypothetical protein
MLGVLAAVTFGWWLGLGQWIILRQALPIPWQWILAVGLSSLFSVGFVGPLFATARPLVFLVLVIYPLLISVTQWVMLRRIVQPCWGWIIVSFLAVLGGGLAGLSMAIAMYRLELSPGMTATIGGLSYGLIYGFITNFSLKQLIQKQHIQQKLIQPPKGLDRPPDSKSLEYQGFRVLSLVSLMVLFVIWIQIFPFPLSTLSKSNGILDAFMPFVIIPVILVYGYFSILAHELGHLGFAISQKFDVRAIAVNRMILSRSAKGWQLRWARRPFAGGFLSSVPRSEDALNKRMFMMILGGPVASLLFAGISMLPWLLQGWTGKTELAWLTAVLSAISLHAAILNTVPMKTSYGSTDGRRMLDLIQNNRSGQRYAAIYAFNSNLHQGVRPSDVDPGIIERALAIPEKSSDHVSALLIAYRVELDKGALPQAANYLDEALQMHLYYPEMLRATLLLEGAYFEATVRNQADVARHWLSQIQETVMTSEISLLRAEASVLIAEGDQSGALAKAMEGLILAKADRLMPGIAIAETAWLQKMIDQISPV